VVDISKRAEFLKKIHLFQGLDDDQLTAIARELQEVSYDAEATIIEQGAPADSFFLIYSGKVRITRKESKQERQLAVLVRGDYFGEEALLTRRRRTATVRAEGDVILFALSRKDLGALLKTSPQLKPNLEVSIKSRKLARKLHFSWVRPDEVIYFLARKHPILLWRALAAPALALTIPFIFLILTGMTNSLSTKILALAFLAAIVLWALWRWVDWGNDYYIVTNQRVVWLEKVIGLYDSRQEAPLSTILSVGVETDMLGRVMDFGNVIVRTFVGRIPFNHVHHPYQAAHMIEEQWQRTKEVSLEAEKEAMKAAIRERLGLPTTSKPVQDARPEAKVPGMYKPGILQILGTNIFKLRYEDSGTITYRKHWVVLLQKIGTPSMLTLFMLILIGLQTYRLFFPAGGASDASSTFLITLLILILIPIGWMIYEYIDWSNDIFQVTADQIFDIDRKPLGTEERRAAPLENILSTEYKRLGLWGYLFNYGTVYITVGGAQLAFEDVWDPAAVQQDIDRRRMARIAKKKAIEKKAERERMAEWLATYHTSADEFKHEENDDEYGENPE